MIIQELDGDSEGGGVEKHQGGFDEFFTPTLQNKDESVEMCDKSAGYPKYKSEVQSDN